MHPTARLWLQPPLLAALLLAASTAPAAEENGKRYVIIHADDAAMSHSVNMATIEGLEQGIVSSCSIMVPCPWFPEFAAYAREHPEKDFGIHLTLNCEWEQYRWGPVAGRDNVPSLCDEDGYLWDNVRQVVRHATAKDVQTELRAQIERAKKFGVNISHLDPHMGAALSRPDLLEIYVNLGIEYGVPVLFSRSVTRKEIVAQYPALEGKGEQLLAALQSRGLPVLDTILQYYEQGPYEERKKVYMDYLRAAEPGVHEIIIHCGIENSELSAITGSAPLRDSDRRIFTDPAVIREIEKMGVEVITWRQFHEMTKKQAAASQ